MISGRQWLLVFLALEDLPRVQSMLDPLGVFLHLGIVRAGQLAGLIQAFQGFLAVFLVACDGMFASISRGNPSDGVTLSGQQLDERRSLFRNSS